jgi:hypothetical protein
MGEKIDIVAERMGNRLGLLMDFLFHEVPVITFVDEIGGSGRELARPLHTVAVDVEDEGAVATDHRPVAIDEIGDLVGEGGERNGIGAEEHFAATVADR